ncbi:MAG: hypothetical protein ACTSVI_03860 [Promethearchaeota archaeon]
MPILWDVTMAVTTGFLFASIRPSLRNSLGLDLDEKITFIFGLFFTCFSNLLISIWCWTDVDQNWLLLYWIDPSLIGGAVFMIYASFPVFYFIGYVTELYLIERENGKKGLLISTTFWVFLTILLAPGFFTLFKGDDTPLLGKDYPSQFLWALTNFPDGNALWIFPVNIKIFFILFTIIVIFYLVIFEYFAIRVYKTDFYTQLPQEKAPRWLVYFTAKILDYSHKDIIKVAKKDYRLRKFIQSFNAVIQISTKDGQIERFLEFNGKEQVVYVKGRASIDSKSSRYAEIIYKSTRDLFKVLASLGDIYEGMLHNRFDLKGNLSLLYKYQLLFNYINPSIKKIKNYKQPIVGELK